jgi:cytochrome c
VKTTAVANLTKLTLAGAVALLSISQAVAEDRADVLERIAPIGKVTVEDQAAAPAAAPAAAAEPASAMETEAAEEATPAVEVTEEVTAAVEAATTEEAAAVGETAAEAVEAAAPAAGEADAMALATTNGCMGCHQIEAKVVGPAYKEVAAKYKDDAGALEMLVGKVKAGGVGTWGQIPMPPNAHVSEDNIRTIVTWVLSL